jgi:hypothetical protein
VRVEGDGRGEEGRKGGRVEGWKSGRTAGGRAEGRRESSGMLHCARGRSTLPMFSFLSCQSVNGAPRTTPQNGARGQTFAAALARGGGTGAATPAATPAAYYSTRLGTGSGCPRRSRLYFPPVYRLRSAASSLPIHTSLNALAKVRK